MSTSLVGEDFLTSSIERLKVSPRQFPVEEMPLVHRFTRGPDGRVTSYSREIFMRSGIELVTKKHKFQHFFSVSQGAFLMRSNLSDEPILVTAPYTGITEPGTRRYLFIILPTVFTTFHPGEWRDVAHAESELVEP